MRSSCGSAEVFAETQNPISSFDISEMMKKSKTKLLRNLFFSRKGNGNRNQSRTKFKREDALENSLITLCVKQVLLFIRIGDLDPDDPAFIVAVIVDQFGMVSQFRIHFNHLPTERHVEW